MERRALLEETLLTSKPKNNPLKELLAPKLKSTPKSGTGFGSSSKHGNNPKVALAEQQAKVVKRDGVCRIDRALQGDTADRLLAHVLEQQGLALKKTQADAGTSKNFYGVENQRKARCDLQLSLLRGGFAADDNEPISDEVDHVLADALQELLGERGTLRYLYEELVTLRGEFYEMAAVVTDPGSNRQQVHPDLPYRDTPPLYVIFLALQDVTIDMGPTSFLLKTHTAKENRKFNDYAQKDDQLVNADCRLSTLKKGDAVLFDARILHCGNANDAKKGQTRALFNFSFRNPEVVADLGYAGSIRPGYVRAMNLGDLAATLKAYEDGDGQAFDKYGDGLGK